tara:strand:+ start:1275 stop:1712 length:438 start_codon:yes stop_codon:yes gene_type:complete
MSDVIKDALKKRIKEHEGYKLDTYMDTLGFKTGGYGHKMLDGEIPPTSKEGWDEIFDKDFEKAWNLMKRFCVENNLTLPLKIQGVICEMIFQMGFAGVSKFRNMIKYLQKDLWADAANEMLNSHWHRQTPNRARTLSDEMRSLAF